MRKTTFITMIWLLVVTGCAETGYWTVEGAANNTLGEGSVLYWPDPNGGAGLTVLGGKDIEDGEIGIGPTVEFCTGPIQDAVLDFVLPGNGAPFSNVPAKPYMKLSGLVDTEDYDWTFVAATGWRIFPDRAIQPAIWAEYQDPSGSNNLNLDEDLVYMIGAVIELRPE